MVLPLGKSKITKNNSGVEVSVTLSVGEIFFFFFFFFYMHSSLSVYRRIIK